CLSEAVITNLNRIIKRVPGANHRPAFYQHPAPYLTFAQQAAYLTREGVQLFRKEILCPGRRRGQCLICSIHGFLLCLIVPEAGQSLTPVGLHAPRPQHSSAVPATSSLPAPPCAC